MYLSLGLALSQVSHLQCWKGNCNYLSLVFVTKHAGRMGSLGHVPKPPGASDGDIVHPVVTSQLDVRCSQQS